MAQPTVSRDLVVEDFQLGGLPVCLEILDLVFLGARLNVVEDECGGDFLISKGDARLEDRVMSGKRSDVKLACFLGDRLPAAWELREDDVVSDNGRLLMVDDAPDSVPFLGECLATI